MATNSQNSKHIVHEKLPGAQDLRFALIVSQWNSEITNRLYEGAHQILQQQQAKQIDRIDVPGSFELVYASRVAIKKNYDAIIAIGNVIRGETSHFDYVLKIQSRIAFLMSFH